jgi:hypothetical protein
VRLRVHADRALVADGSSHVVMLYPFWGKNAEDPGDPNTGRFDRYAEEGSRLFELAPLESADVVVFPREWSPSLAEDVARVAAEARDAGKPTVVFAGGDDYAPVPDATLALETSLYRSQRQPNEFALPAWSEDFVTAHLGGELPLRKRGPRPVVGFCGLAPRRRGFLGRLRTHAAHAGIRGRALQLLQAHGGVETNFVVRAQFLGGAVAGGSVDAAAMTRVRREYVQNMVDSDYVLCARGAGNFSYRLYETLSCGRIPVFVDTDCVLPLEFTADWRSHCVWIDAGELDSIGDRVAEFHEALGDDDFVELQRECRRFWKEYVAPEGFFAHFHEHLAR